MQKVTDVKVHDDYRLELKFDDGVQGIVELSHLVGKGVFNAWRDYEFFKHVEIGTSGELVWGGQIDLCPDSLYLRVTGKKPEDIFPKLRKEETIHA